MSTVVKRIVIPNNRRIDIELPPDTPVGEAVVTLTIEPKNDGVKQTAGKSGAVDSLLGIIVDDGLSLDEVRAERLEKHERDA